MGFSYYALALIHFAGKMPVPSNFVRGRDSSKEYNHEKLRLLNDQ